jgi:fructokinase
VTHGAKGCTCLTRTGHVRVSGFSVRPVDTTGAGDAFVAGFLSGLLTRPDAPLTDLCRFANGAGALATTQRGAIPAMPTRDAVLSLLAAQPAATENTES